MTPKYLKIILALGLVYFMANGFLNRAIKRPPGILVAEEPIQKDLPPSANPIIFKSDVLQPLAEYSIKARVLSKERYRFDWGAKYAPWDLALGWKQMSDSRILDQLSISQMGRWYFVGWRKQPVETNKIFENSSNMHVIPANHLVNRMIGRLRVGDIVRLKGQLVRVDARDGGEWRSSTSRTDQYSGACEVMYVQTVEVF